MAGFWRSQFRKVVEWEEDYNVGQEATIVYKYPIPSNEEMMRKSKLIVREGQKALLVYKGKLVKIYEPGTYDLDELENIPLLSNMYNWKYFWKLTNTADVFYISTKQFLDMKWGTTNPVIMEDSHFGVIRLRGFGVYSFAAKDPEIMLRELFGSMKNLKVRDIEEYVKKIIVSKLSDAIAEQNIPILRLARSYDEIAALTKEKIQKELDQFGVEIKSLYIQNLSLPQEVEKMIDKRSNVGIMSDVIGKYTQLQAADAIKDSANNPNGISGMGVGLGAGVSIGGIFGEAFRSSQSSAQKENASNIGYEKTSEDKIKCIKCSALIKSTAKFCPECGAKQTKTCSACKIEIKTQAKFCPECGVKQ